eukprot:1172921-Rhodomonas_salina.3
MKHITPGRTRLLPLSLASPLLLFRCMTMMFVEIFLLHCADYQEMRCQLFSCAIARDMHSGPESQKARKDVPG